jgi:hypothetical protein
MVLSKLREKKSSIFLDYSIFGEVCVAHCFSFCDVFWDFVCLRIDSGLVFRRFIYIIYMCIIFKFNEIFLFQKMLKYEPSQRISAKAALTHPYFSNVCKQRPPQIMK